MERLTSSLRVSQGQDTDPASESPSAQHVPRQCTARLCHWGFVGGAGDAERGVVFVKRVRMRFCHFSHILERSDSVIPHSPSSARSTWFFHFRSDLTTLNSFKPCRKYRDSRWMKTSQDSADSLDKAGHYSFCLCNTDSCPSVLPSMRGVGEYSEICIEIGWTETSKEAGSDSWGKKSLASALPF